MGIRITSSEINQHINISDDEKTQIRKWKKLNFIKNIKTNSSWVSIL
jgi:hypothetical protein